VKKGPVGIFDVYVDEWVVYSNRREGGRLPKNEEVIRRIRITKGAWLCRQRHGRISTRKLRRRSTSLRRSRNAGPAAAESLDLKPLVIAARHLAGGKAPEEAIS
jgi:hypothetical protein